MNAPAAPFPASSTVRAARDAYLEENGFSAEAYQARWTDASFFGVRFVVPNTAQHRWGIMLHDLHHVATGYGTDLTGEAEISAWEIHRSFRALGPYVGSVVASGVVLGALIAPRRTLAAWRQGKAMRSLHALLGHVRTPAEREAAYEELLGLTVGELRQRLAVPAEGLCTDRRLHDFAPAHA
jgi:hypothetical protein